MQDLKQRINAIGARQLIRVRTPAMALSDVGHDRDTRSFHLVAQTKVPAEVAPVRHQMYTLRNFSSFLPCLNFFELLESCHVMRSPWLDFVSKFIKLRELCKLAELG